MDNRPIYKTAEELGVEQWEHDGLVALVGPLARGDLKLWMSSATEECGTCHCIGGWIAFNRHMNSYGVEQYVAEARSGSSLSGLFYPSYKGSWASIKSAQAARAIVNFLVTGDPQWDAVMAAE